MLRTVIRASALSWKGLQDAFLASYKANRYISLPAMLMGMKETIKADAAKATGSELYPYGRDAQEFYAVIESMVQTQALSNSLHVQTVPACLGDIVCEYLLPRRCSCSQ